MSSGTRELGTANIQLDNVNLDAKQPHAKIILKGGDEHVAYIDRETVKDLDRYIAARRRHPHASSPYLWLGPRGHMTSSGLYQMVVRRSELAGVKVTVHDFRRFAASTLLERGSSVDDVMTLLGGPTGRCRRGTRRAPPAHELPRPTAAEPRAQEI